MTSSRNLTSGLSPISISNALQTEQKPINNNSRVTKPFKIRTGENTMGSDDEDWDTSPSPTTETKKSSFNKQPKAMPEKVKKKVNNISFITSLEQIDAMITPKKPSVSKLIQEVSPKIAAK